MISPDPPKISDPESEETGVPGFRTWRRIYVFVFAFFVLVVILLTLFSRLYA
jgi:hypothetical protein